jgi:hypothetical protein
MQFSQTDIIVEIQGIEVDPAIPQTATTPRFLRIRARTMTGQLDVCISEAAAEELAEVLARRPRVSHSL